MKALVLGSTGFFGSATARLLANRHGFNELVLASRYPSNAEALASDLDSNVEVIALDILDAKSLSGAVEGVDVVVNAAGATLQTAILAMSAAAESSTPYCDIAAEADVLLQAEAIESSLACSKSPIVMGAGFHPGLTDLFGAHAIAQLDLVSSVDLYVIGNFPDYGDANGMIEMLDSGWEGTEGLKTILAGIGLPAIIVRNKARQSVSPWSTYHTHSNPDGFDVDFTWFATLEPIALNRRFRAIDELAIHYGAWPNCINKTLRTASREVMTGDREARAALRDIFSASLIGDAPELKIHFWAEAKGTKDGKPATAKVYSRSPWASNTNMIATTTGILGYAAEKLAKDEIEGTGLKTASEAFTPEEIFAHLSGKHEPEVTVDITF